MADASDCVVGRKFVVDRTQSVHRRLWAGSVTSLVQTPLDFVLRDLVGARSQGQTAGLELVEVDVLLVAQQHGEIGHVLGKPRHRNRRRREGVDAEFVGVVSAHAGVSLPTTAL
jgi:hypothetical protein